MRTYSLSSHFSHQSLLFFFISFVPSLSMSFVLEKPAAAYEIPLLSQSPSQQESSTEQGNKQGSNSNSKVEVAVPILKDNDFSVPSCSTSFNGVFVKNLLDEKSSNYKRGWKIVIEKKPSNQDLSIDEKSGSFKLPINSQTPNSDEFAYYLTNDNGDTKTNQAKVVINVPKVSNVDVSAQYPIGHEIYTMGSSKWKNIDNTSQPESLQFDPTGKLTFAYRYPSGIFFRTGIFKVGEIQGECPTPIDIELSTGSSLKTIFTLNKQTRFKKRLRIQFVGQKFGQTRPSTITESAIKEFEYQN